MQQIHHEINTTNCSTWLIKAANSGKQDRKPRQGVKMGNQHKECTQGAKVGNQNEDPRQGTTWNQMFRAQAPRQPLGRMQV